MNNKNPIEKELDKVEDQWEAFVKKQVPILRWLLSSGSNQMVSTFIRVQEECGDGVSDLFIPLYSPMETAERYGNTLADELSAKVEEAAEQIEQEGESSIAWPSFLHADNGFDALLGAAQTLLDAFGEGFDCLALVLRPSKVSAARDWRLWCDSLAALAAEERRWPKKLRIVVMDDVRYPVLNSVAEKHEHVIDTLTPPVDLKQAMSDVFDAADDGSPGAAYRKHLVALHHGVEEGNLTEVKQHSEKALAIAGEHQWYDLWVAILFLRAGAYVANDRVDDGIFDYQTAQRFAKMGHDQGVEGCGKSGIYALLGEASAWLAQKKWSEASVVYQSSAQRSLELKEHFFHMDSWRMVSFCEEQQKLKQEAWQSANRALNAAEPLSDDERLTSTLPYVGDMLMRLAPSESDRREAEQQLKVYLGDDWRDMLAQVEQESAPC